jgi:type VI secretion system secreted protein Hcp
MALAIYLSLQDDGGAKIKGSVTVNEREGTIEVLACEHTVDIPTNDSTGKLTGTRVHSPYKFTKEVDASSIYFHQAVTSGKTLKSAQFSYYHINGSGLEEFYYSITLEDVKVGKMTSKMYDINDPVKKKYDHLEDIELRYEKVTWHYADGNLEHSDSWTERKSA